MLTHRKRLWKRFAAASLSVAFALQTVASAPAQSPFGVSAPTAVSTPVEPVPPAYPSGPAITTSAPAAPMAMPTAPLPPAMVQTNAVPPVAPTTIATPAPTAPMQPPVQPTVQPAVHTSGSPAVALVNRPQVSLNCRIDKVGPSGIAKVGVWVTPDGGATWQRLNDATFRQNSLDIQLPGEGVFGIRPVAVNGNGFGGAAPAPGQAPAFWVEVDATAPVVQLGNINPVTEGGTLTLSWNSQDKNFGQGPVTLHYRTQPQGMWKQIATNLNAQGSMRWQFPRDQGAHFYFRAVAVDRCGNIAQSETPNPVQLDMTEPELVIVGAAAAERQNAPQVAPVQQTQFQQPAIQQTQQPMQQQVQQQVQPGTVIDGSNAIPSNEAPALPTETP